MASRTTVLLLGTGLFVGMGSFACRPTEQNSKLPSAIAQPNAKDGKLVIEADKPVRWSTTLNTETRRAIQGGRRRLALNLVAYEPPTSGAGILVVYLLNANKTGRKEINRFGVHPDAAFRASDRLEPQRFLISLADYPKYLDESEVHLEIGFDSSQVHLKGGMAEISIGFVDI